MGVTDKDSNTGFTSASRNALAKRTSRPGEPCAKCGRELRADEPAVVRGWSRMLAIGTYPDGTLGSYIYLKDGGARCVGCASLRGVSEHVWQFVFDFRGKETWGSRYRELPCASCSRPTIRDRGHRNRRYTFCSHPCEVAYHNHRRRKPKEQKRCEVCDAAFTATRSDQKTCSQRCKQKAYRRRKKVAD